MNKTMWTNPAVWDDGTPRSQGNAFDWRATPRRPARKRAKPKKTLRERKRQALLNL